MIKKTFKLYGTEGPYSAENFQTLPIKNNGLKLNFLEWLDVTRYENMNILFNDQLDLNA